MWQKAESRGQVPTTDGKQRAQTNSTNHTRCLRQKESKTPHMTTQRAWHVAEGREQIANVKERWHANGTNQFNKPHQTPDKNIQSTWPHKANGMWEKAESRRQMSKTDGKQWAQTSSTSHIKCLRQKEGKNTQDHTKQMECGRRQRAEGKCPKTDGKQRAQTNSTNHTRCLRQKECKSPHMTTQRAWHGAEGRAQSARVKDRWQTEGTNKLNKLHQMSKTNRT